MEEGKVRILVGVDVDESHHTFAEALALAGRLSAELEILSATPLRPPESPPFHVNERAFDRAERRTAALVDEAAACGVVARAHVEEDEPAQALLEAAHRLAPTFLVVGRHRGGELGRVLFGSVAEQVCRHSPVPVLVVPPPEPALPLATRDPVEEAGQESFPASDPPAWQPLVPGVSELPGEDHPLY